MAQSDGRNWFATGYFVTGYWHTNWWPADVSVPVLTRFQGIGFCLESKASGTNVLVKVLLGN